MKRILLSTVTLGLAAGAFGCTNLDEKLITGVSSQYYSTPDGLNSAVIASYAQLRGYYGREQLLSLQQVGTDTWMAADQAGSNNKEFDSYNGGLNSTVAPVANTWNPAYQAINTLNAALDRGPSATGISSAVKNSLLGEAHFLRALNYFNLVRQFGDVTLEVHENKGVAVEATRDPASAVYQLIIADLDSAVTLLPPTQSDFGRATRGAAQALRSQVYLTRAYQAFSPGKQGDFQQAAADAKAVISSGTYSLEPVFADLFCVARPADPGRTGYCDNTGYNGNRKEFIFTVQFGPNGVYNATNVDADNEYNYLHLVYLGQYDNNGIWVGTPRDLNNGRPFRRLMPTPYELSVWNKWIGTPGASDILDTRFDGTFQTVWNVTAGGVKNSTTNCPACTSGATENAGDTASVYYPFGVTTAYRQAHAFQILTPCPTQQIDSPAADFSAAGYCGDRNNANDGYFNWQRFPSLKKFQDNLRANLTAQEGGKVQVIMRLAEMYLVVAEADVALGNTAEAAQMVNVLHQRAASPAHKNDYNVTAGQMTLDYVMDERERELAGEFTRWYDITRPGVDYFLSRVKKYNPHAAPNVAAKHLLRPIPQSQIDGVVVGPKYPQNVGY
ncbi:MAG TPA: RagB/SusD family nutrient uptake outer membrane protein [Gemmatimonadaceae bacterium]|nr:RagB/SusD family nutrient uptake outer membrane protein [Gemmatimonadaceae bacterium]